MAFGFKEKDACFFLLHFVSTKTYSNNFVNEIKISSLESQI